MLVLLSVIRIFIYAFWGEGGEVSPNVTKQSYNRLFYPTALLVVISIAYGVGSEWITPFMANAADVLSNPSVYVDAVMKGGQ